MGTTNLPAVPLGAALEYTQAQLGGPCSEVDSFPVAQVAAGVIINGSADRVGLLIMNIGANIVMLGLNPGITIAQGIELAPGGGLFAMNVRDDFTLPSRAWYAIANGGTSQMYVLEIARYRYTQVNK